MREKQKMEKQLNKAQSTESQPSGSQGAGEVRREIIENLQSVLLPGAQVKSGGPAGYDRKPGGVCQPCWNNCWKVARIKV